MRLPTAFLAAAFFIGTQTLTVQAAPEGKSTSPSSKSQSSKTTPAGKSESSTKAAAPPSKAEKNASVKHAETIDGIDFSVSLPANFADTHKGPDSVNWWDKAGANGKHSPTIKFAIVPLMPTDANSTNKQLAERFLELKKPSWTTFKYSVGAEKKLNGRTFITAYFTSTKPKYPGEVHGWYYISRVGGNRVFTIIAEDNNPEESYLKPLEASLSSLTVKEK